MDPAWIALLGTAIGATGATGAAAITGRAGRRQVKAQNISQQRVKRHETYRDFLVAGAQARDELAAIWRLLKAPDRDVSAISLRLQSAQALVDAVRQASAANFVEGPKLILEPTRRVEESIVLFDALLGVTLNDLGNGRDAKARLRLCTRHLAHVRDLADRFSAAAREALGDAKQEHELLRFTSAPNSAEELAWLVRAAAEMLEAGEDVIDVKRPLVETGLISLDLLEILERAPEELGLTRDDMWPISSLLFTTSVENVAGYIASLRTT